MKEELIKKLGGKCQLCGYNKCRTAFDFHHIGKEKENCISVLIGHAPKEILSTYSDIPGFINNTNAIKIIV